MLDLNDTAPPDRSSYDLDDLSARLAASASSWVPQYFSQGRISDDRSELRLANISGSPPRKQGSCVIGLTGDMAGAWHDFDGGEGGGPLSTLKHATGKDGRELLDLAAEITGTKQDLNGAYRETPPSSKVVLKPPRDPSAEIAHILARSVPLAGTPAETYLKSRGLEDPQSPDLLFCANVTDWKAGMGRPAMIAIPRRADGLPTGGIHRTFLAYDGAGKAAIDKPKKMLGPMENGAVRLMPMGTDGRLGIAEGIETALAAGALYGLPVWAATAAPFLGGEDKMANWIGFVPPKDTQALYIFTDKGNAGRKVAEALLRKALENGLPAAIVEPAGDDDFNADLLAGVPPRVLPELQGSLQPPPQEQTVETQPYVAEALALLIGRIDRGWASDKIENVIHQIALSGASVIATRQMLDSVRRRAGVPMRDVDITYRQHCRDIRKSASHAAGSWMGKMILTDSGEPRQIMENAAAVFESAPEFQGVLWYDEFTNRPMMRRPAPWDKLNGSFIERPWTDADDSEATRWLQRAGVLVPTLLVHEAALTVAFTAAYHPVREYLGELEWDRKERLDFWGIDYLGAEETAYTKAVSARWMISAVARVMQPGIKADHLLVLEGEQGTYKSTVLRALFDPWFSDDPAEMGNKDAAIQLAGVWCLEYADLDRFNRADRNRLKAFVSRQVDRYRPPFGRYAMDFPRQIVFAGTTNDTSYLDDPTGARRIWPLKAACPDPIGIREVRDHLWAEAFYRYNCGEKFYLAESDLQQAATSQQRARQHEEAWGHKIRYVLQGRESMFPLQRVTVSEILEGMGIPIDRWNTLTYNRVRDHLQFIGWQEDPDVDDGKTFLRPN